MRIFKKKKAKLALVGSSAFVGSLITIASIWYLSQAKNTNSVKLNLRDPQMKIQKGDLDLNNANPSITDQNIPKIIKIVDEVKPAEPKPIPNPPTPIAPELEPLPKPKPPVVTPIPTPIPKPPVEKPKPKENEEIKVTHNKRKITIFGVQVEVDVEERAKRVYNPSDVQKGITNLNPYYSEIAFKITNVEVTEELINKNMEHAKQGLGHVFPGIQDLPEDDTEKFKWEEHIRNNRPWFDKQLWKFKDFIDAQGDNIVNWFKEEFKGDWQKIKAEPNEIKKMVLIVKRLDMSKFKKLSNNAEKYLRQGLTADDDNVFINKDGEIDSRSFSPFPGSNSTFERIKRDNQDKRVFGFDSEIHNFKRPSNSIMTGDYPGWKRTKIWPENDERFKDLGIGNTDGIEIHQLKREKEQEGKLNEGIVITIDFSNEAGYQKSKEIIKKLKDKKVEITSYRFLNVGKIDANQKMGEIVQELPDVLPQLEVFFETMNTDALKYLENKHIKELSLITTGNSLRDEWTINPFGLKKVEWVNTVDYNVSSDYSKWSRIATRITFDTIGFDEEDEKLNRINDGLRMVYFVRNNEPFFQGGLGPGLSPDHNEGENSWPLGLDLSKIKSRKSLRGLIFNDELKPSNGTRKLKRLTLYNDSNTFEIDADELNNSQFADIMITKQPQMPKTKIFFSNRQTRFIKISGKSGPLTEQGFRHLKVLLEYGDGLKRDTVKTDNEEIANFLKAHGLNVDASQDDNEYN
ncbi:putative immunoglobulin-blocking virulence protein [Metamycoplasma hyosynoviae]|uniref:putative immunoglobulin-blocking virulence protein n=1 Tax=Metamycoplasma hyosynoviae TaxID=29559 RepID=UPI00235A39A7|nr:putative immunoglobulin-blocking virulence protein [Metamycoplasma hyosynoviae]MDC8900763.1 putative immunoglobulin-blocking virulence protein [Metamycoplasma hyosynoviae]MDC8912278.1 putative immunoglobulin-blocking virulence protein [Metamycoplasma hyosynoviae]MDC8912809.1 putative immunoglobulin-blocking virulence protein [Metamycoplasma hyosynoviae]MDC8914838.1 putative immunoglobulin-blocking virulence protein [Metamycoplasma hyosynoviae]